MSTTSSGQSAGQLETRGIEPVPEGECNGHPLQLFWVWFAANISILGLPLGATLVAFRGLAIWQAIIVAILGAAGSFAVGASSPSPVVVDARRASPFPAPSSACVAISGRRWCR